jgi:hypothetical protein
MLSSRAKIAAPLLLEQRSKVSFAAVSEQVGQINIGARCRKIHRADSKFRA